jgi:glutamate formiminotransferase
MSTLPPDRAPSPLGHMGRSPGCRRCATVSVVLECVVNLSEGRRAEVVAAIAAEAGPLLLDVHRDVDHHRSVLTLAGPSKALEDAVRAVARAAVAELDLRAHEGAHPRIGVLDVVPFVDLIEPRRISQVAVAARDRFAAWAGDELSLPCFVYGPERTLPDVRRGAFTALVPDAGPISAHPTAGACAVGARPVLVAFNLWLADADLSTARRVAAAIRGTGVRALGLAVGAHLQVSCNLIDPYVTGPAEIYDRVAAQMAVVRAELVGLLPAEVLEAVPASRWAELDLDPSKTIEGRLA